MSSIILAGFTIRPATINDFDSVLSLVIAQNMAGYGEPMISADNLRELWQSSNLDLAQDTWVAFAPDGQLAGYAELQHDSPTQFTPSVYLVSAYQRKDIGAHLLQLAETRASSSNPGASSVALIGRASEYNQIGKQTFEDAGYALRLSFLIMERVMTAPPEPAQWTPGITVRTFITGRDEPATYQADEEAADDKGYHLPLTFADWAKRMSLDTAEFDPTLWFLAGSEDEIAGVALNFYSPTTHTGWIDHLGVRRQWRNKGIGQALLLHTFAEFYRRGIYRLRLSVDSKSLTNAPRLYERASMGIIQQYHIYKKVNCSGRKLVP